MNWWPWFDLRITAAVAGHALLLRTPTDADLAALMAIAPAELEMDPTLPGGSLGEWIPRHVWRARAEAHPDDWRLVFLLESDGEVAGTQDLKATAFPRRRIVETASWLGHPYRGRGLAKAMRAMVLHLAFTETDAVAAESESEEHNDAALGVTRSLGYQPCGDAYEPHRDRVDHMLRARLTRQRWSLLRGGYGVNNLHISGADRCLPLLVGQKPAPVVASAAVKEDDGR